MDAVTKTELASNYFRHDEVYALLEGILAGPSGIAIIATDTEFRINRCNHIAAKVFGLTPEQLIGQRVPEIHDRIGVDNRRFYRAVEQAVKHGEYRFPQKINTPGGKRQLDSHLIPLNGEAGVLRGYMLMARDVTELADAEDNRRKLIRAVDQSPVSIIITDTRGVIEYVNARFSQITGYSATEVIGRRMAFLKSGLTAPETYADLWHTIKAGKEWASELCNRRKNGELYWDAVRIMPILDSEGNVTHFVSLQEDISARKQSEQQISESESRFRAIFDNSRDGIVLLHNGLAVLVNPACAAMFGFEHPDLMHGRPILEIFAANSRDMVRDNIHMRTAGQPAPTAYEARGLRHHEGIVSEFDIELRVSVYDLNGERYILALIRDVSERKANEENLRLWATVFQNSGEAAMITDPANRIIQVNDAFVEITGYSAAEVLGKTPQMLSSGRHDRSFFQQMWQALLDDHHWQGEIWDRRKNGEIYPKWLGITAVYDAQGCLTHYVAIFSDISERKAAQDKIEYLAHHDPLTGLPNRLLLGDRFLQAMAHADRAHEKIAVLFLDLDRFKTINDSLGHPIGDKLLQALARRLNECIRDTDTISRQGGDEFVIVLTELRDTDTAVTITQKILQHVSAAFEIDSQMLNVSFSIGISLYPDDGRDFDTLLKKSDAAMYHAKEAGRNTYRFFTEQMNTDGQAHLLIQNLLQHALDRGELLLHYQPQVDLVSGRIVGSEALLRWNSPELGLVPPDRFIPIAEETGQIVAIGEWVLHEACRQGQRWRSAGLPPLSMAVNISAIQLRRGNLVATVLAALADSGFSASCLELEFTESILIHDVEKTMDTVHELQALGIKIAIDDFGTGYSSLSYLKRFAVDRIKIDRSFVRDISSDPDDAAIVRAIIQMARSLNMITLAEGAETREQIDYLCREGCQEVQGFFYSRPLDAHTFSEFLAGHSI